MKFKALKAFIMLLLVASLFAGCGDTPKKTEKASVKSQTLASSNSADNDEADKKETTDSTKSDSTQANNTTQADNKSNSKQSNNSSKQVASTSTAQASVKSSPSDKGGAYSEQNITEKVKDYIVNGQGNKPAASKLNWSKTFLDKVDIVSLYKKYKAGGGNANDLEGIAKYVTLNAPIQSNWQDMFKKDLNDAYGETVVRLEHLSDDLYQAYVKKDNKEVPFVAVSARTGYFHG